MRSTSNAIYFEIGVIFLDFIAALLAIAVGLYVSVWLGLLLFVVLALGLISLICNYDAWVVRRLSTQENPLLLSLCRTGFVGRVRRMLRMIFGPAVQVLPSSVWWCWESDRHKGVVGKPKLLPTVASRRRCLQRLSNMM